MSFGVTATGFVLKELTYIIADMEAEAIVQFGADVDLTSTSPLKKFIQVIAAEQARLWLAMEQAYYAGYLDFATGANLDNLASLIGIVRKAAIKATGQVTFTGVNGTIVPAGSEVQTEGSNPIVFKTDASVTIAAGTATADITASVAGLDGNVAIGTIIVLTNPISGISAVTNAGATTGGDDAESDEEFRNRIKISLASGGAATLDALRAGVLAVTGVVSCGMEENDTITDYTGSGGLPPKSFRATVLGGADNDVAQAIFDNRAAGIESYGDTSGNAYSDDGTLYVTWFRRATEIIIYVDVTVTHDDTYPSDGDTQVETAIITYIGGTDAGAVEHLGLDVGADVIFNEVVAAVMSIQGVTDAVVKIDTVDPPTGTTNVAIASDEKATTTIAAVDITS